jgi:hypothetical protein
MAEPTNRTTRFEAFAAIADANAVHFLGPLNDVDAMALLGCMAEDPATWNDVALVWPRYVYHADNTEFADSLPMRETSIESAIDDLQASPAWFVADMTGRRVFAGGKFPRLRLRGTASNHDEDGPVETTIVLPPWWELRQSADAVEIMQPRNEPLAIPRPNRDVIWGSAMTDFMATRMLEILHSGSEWIDYDGEDRPCGKREHTLTVHRDWLMSPRSDLNDKTPRDCIHGGINWISSLAEGQEFRVHEGNEPVPVSTELSTFEYAAFGRHEMVMYFDACRDTIGLGWLWLIERQDRLNNAQLIHEFPVVMQDLLKAWLASPFEGGPTAESIIQSDRLRVPLYSTGASHIIDCDCPICEMMASDMFGPSFRSYDGYMLEMDNDFAFSMFDTLEEWEQEQRDYAELSAKIDADIARRKELGINDSDEFQSAWKTTYVADGIIPGDRGGHLSTAFFVAELVSTLKQEGVDQSDVDLLNAAFRTYRTADSPESAQSATDAFKQTLNDLAKRHEFLVSRNADLQSRIDEQLRFPAFKDDDFDDVPF